MSPELQRREVDEIVAEATATLARLEEMVRKLGAFADELQLLSRTEE